MAADTIDNLPRYLVGTAFDFWYYVLLAIFKSVIA